jgi:hypothetical protein
MFPDVDRGRQVAKPVSIFNIFPDVEQPRRAMPSVVRNHWDGKPTSMANVFDVWYHLAGEERGEQVNIVPYLLAGEETERPEKIGPIEGSLLEIVMLAANIRANGLTNPITVVHTPEGYRLETGERRWLAYHILHALHTHLDDEASRWEKIPARSVDSPSVWRQAGENNARANLNAVGKARQLAILIMDLYRQQGMRFGPYHLLVPAGECDRAYYAQVADGSRYPVPRGSGEAVMNAMGFKQPSQLREHRALLKLPDEVWRVADDLNWTQGRIRDLSRQAGEDDNILTQLVYQYAFAEQYRVGIPTPEDIPNSPYPTAIGLPPECGNRAKWPVFTRKQAAF